MDGKTALLALLMLGIVLASGCTEPLDEQAETVKASTNEWLETEDGIAKFPDGDAGTPIRVWKGGEVFYWIVPIEGRGLYIGNLIADKEEFAIPKQVITYKEPRSRILNYTQSEAHQQMIAENDYPAYQIGKPILLAIEGKGLYWYSEVKSNNEVLEELYLETFTLF